MPILWSVIMGKGDLAALIAERKGDRSYDQLERDGEGVPTSARWHQLATGPMKRFPDPKTIDGITRALGVTVTEVVMAAARSLGVDVREDSHGSLSTAGLTPRQTQVVRMVIRELAAKETPSDGTPIAPELTTHETHTADGAAVLDVEHHPDDQDETDEDQQLGQTGEPAEGAEQGARERP